jgi:sestrin
MLEHEFRLNGGDEAWLEGAEHAPPKLRAILPLIATLARQPWRVGPAHIGALVSAGWSIGEVVSAIILACSYFALAGVAFGAGVNPEPDLDDPVISSSSPQESDSEDADSKISEQETASLAEKLRRVQQEQGPQDTDKELQDEAATAAVDAVVERTVSPSAAQQRLLPFYEKYLTGVSVEYEEFDVHSREYTKFPVQEFNWTEHGYELVSRFFSAAAPLLDELFKLTYDLTYNTLSGAANIGTEKFRQAIWYYVQRIHGVEHEDYDYHDVNEFVHVDVKRYVKKVARCSHKVAKKDFSHMGISLRPDEKVHICLLAVESHKQVVILYGLHAVMKFMSG